MANLPSLTRKNGDIFYELRSEIMIYPLDFLGRNKLFFYMRRPEPRAIMEAFRENSIRRKQRGRLERSIQLQDLPKIKKLIDDHFIRFSGALLEDGSEPTPAQQRQWLDENEDIKIRIFREGFDRFYDSSDQEIDPASPVDPGKLIISLAQKNQTIKCSHDLSDGEFSETVHLTVTIESLNKQEKRRYDRAFTLIENSKSGIQYTETDWNVYSDLFDQKVTSIEGALVGGEDCSADNKAEWVPLIPLSLKIFCMAEMALDIELKKA